MPVKADRSASDRSVHTNNHFKRHHRKSLVDAASVWLPLHSVNPASPVASIHQPLAKSILLTDFLAKNSCHFAVVQQPSLIGYWPVVSATNSVVS